MASERMRGNEALGIRRNPRRPPNQEPYGEHGMSSIRTEGVTLRQAALIVGFAYLLNPVSYAEFTIYPKLVIPGHIEQTVANIGAHHGLFLTAFFCYLINFIEDIIIAWGLYILLAPVNRALALLAAWFQLIYAAIAISVSLTSRPCTAC